MARSLISAAVGWLAGIAVFTLHFLVSVGRSSLGGIPSLAAISGVAIFLIWLFLLWPLYTFVPFRSALWRPLVCVSCGAVAAGVLLLAFFMLMLSHDPHPLRLISLPFLYVGPLIGAVTCAVGVVLKSRENKRAT
jgi:hypothetical protein